MSDEYQKKFENFREALDYLHSEMSWTLIRSRKKDNDPNLNDYFRLNNLLKETKDDLEFLKEKKGEELLEYMKVEGKLDTFLASKTYRLQAENARLRKENSQLKEKHKMLNHVISTFNYFKDEN